MPAAHKKQAEKEGRRQNINLWYLQRITRNTAERLI